MKIIYKVGFIPEADEIIKVYNSSGIIRQTKEKIGKQVALILVSAPSAVNFYPKAGFTKIEDGFIIKREK